MTDVADILAAIADWGICNSGFRELPIPSKPTLAKPTPAKPNSIAPKKPNGRK
jgi:hypothetical protein